MYYILSEPNQAPIVIDNLDDLLFYLKGSSAGIPISILKVNSYSPARDE